MNMTDASAGAAAVRAMLDIGQRSLMIHGPLVDVVRDLFTCVPAPERAELLCDLQRLHENALEARTVTR